MRLDTILRMTSLLPNKSQCITLLIALVAGLIFFGLGIPLPFLFGSLGSCLIIALLGLPLQGTPLLSTISRTVLGVAIGTSITWTLLSQALALTPTLLMVPVYVLVIALCGSFYFHKLMRYDKVTAYYAAMPGALQDMVVFGEEAGGNPRTLSLIHATRLVLMITLAPLILIHVYQVNLDNPLGSPSTELPIYHNFLIVLVGIAGWQIAKRLNMFGASVIGPMLISIALSLTGLLTERPSAEAIMVSQFFIGIGVGVNYKGITSIEVRRDILATAGFVLLLLVLAFICIQLSSYVSNVPSVQRFLSFWPTGQAEIAILSLAAGANVGVVVIHHLVRMVFIILGAPIAARYLMRDKPD